MNTPSYFELRGITYRDFSKYHLPPYLDSILTRYNCKNLLDIGCGNGDLILSVSSLYGIDCAGIDICPEAVKHCKSKGLNVELINCISDYSKNQKIKYDLVVMSHVLEHIDKERIIQTLRDIRENLLVCEGSLLVVVPNAQSNTGCYWAYEDFQHTCLFTSGSIRYVLLSAGFRSVEFIDPRCTNGMRLPNRIVRIVFSKIFEIKTAFWNVVTSNSFHKPSPNIFSYEIKCIAR